MRSASRLRCPRLVIGSAPPVDSITISDQMRPVEMCTDAILEMATLSSLLPNSRPLRRETRCGLTTSLVGKTKFPFVQREAVNVSAGEESIALSAGLVKVWSRHDSGLDPFEGALVPDPDVANDQNGQEDQHFHQPK